MKTIKVEIEGTTPLLMNKYNVEAELERQKGKRITKIYDPKIESEKSAYWGTGKKKKNLFDEGLRRFAAKNSKKTTTKKVKR